ncbi:TPA: hypothetical protein L6B13_01900 [Pseudomonas aeruginosa]|nr:hypothetical protein [Pseudomonas aeruginosa]
MTESKICTCPSGDGSLRWPCPAHPAEQAGGDERAAFEAWMTWLMDHVYGRLPDFTLDDGSGAHYVNADVSYAWTAWQARAALEQSSPTPVCTTPTGENCPGDGVKSCKKCPEQAEAEAEQPEVVAFIHERTGAVANAEMVRAMEEGSVLSGYSIGLATLAQHDRDVGAQRAYRT